MGHEREEQSWFAKNWTWVIGCGCVLPVILAVGGIASLVFFASNMVKEAGFQQEALERARSAPAVVERLGSPIETTGIPMGNIRIDDAGGHADYVIGVQGPEGKGRLTVVAMKVDGEWVLEKLEFEPDGDGERLDLLAPATESP